MADPRDIGPARFGAKGVADERPLPFAAGERTATDVARGGLFVPLAYAEGYDKAVAEDAALAERYIRHTMIGDPPADRAVEALRPLVATGRDGRVIAAVLTDPEAPPPDTPEALRALVAEAARVPEWFDPDTAMLATRAFLRNSDLILAALATGSIVAGFSTLISKSFNLRGRFVENGVRRLKQNVVHMTDQFLPGGMLPGGDGWKLTLRIRIVHAQVRMMLAESGEWDVARYGLPLHAGHMAFGAAYFSGALMAHVARLGGDFTREEAEAYVHVWRHTGSVMGIPAELMFDDVASSRRLAAIAARCEPQADEDAIIMANCLINSIPLVMGISEPGERRRHAARMYQISRELIGDEAADAFRYPPATRFRRLPWLRLARRSVRLLQKVFPRVRAHTGFTRFGTLLHAGDLGQPGHSYALPTTVFDEDSRHW